MLKRPGGEIHYEEYGNGFPILLYAPGGLRSNLGMWRHPANGPQRSWCDWTEVLAPHFRVVAMDQRNAGTSKTDIRADHGWHTYAADHMALMDHLGHERFHVLGGCIGGSFCLKAIEVAPERIAAAVLQNPIGLHPVETDYFPKSAIAWNAEKRAERPELKQSDLEGFAHNMWDHDFVFCVDRAFVKRCPVPTMLLPGTDVPHPAATSAELAAQLPGVEVLEHWRGPEHMEQQAARVTDFLLRHTPK